VLEPEQGDDIRHVGTDRVLGQSAFEAEVPLVAGHDSAHRLGQLVPDPVQVDPLA
jgi:hypothetical protein